MIRKLLAIHRNLFLDAVNSNSVPFPIISTDYEYGLILGSKITDIYPTLKDIVIEHIQSEKINEPITKSNIACQLKISNDLRLIMLMLFNDVFAQMHLLKRTIMSYLAGSPTIFSKLLSLDSTIYKSRPIFQIWKSYFENVFINANDHLIVDDPNIDNYDYVSIKSPILRFQKLQTPISLDIVENNERIRFDNTSELMSVLKDIRASQQIIMTTLLEINKKLKD